jgi:hypothetical protein
VLAEDPARLVELLVDEDVRGDQDKTLLAAESERRNAAGSGVPPPPQLESRKPN